MTVGDPDPPHRYGLLLGLVLSAFVLLEALPSGKGATLVAGAVQGVILLVALRTSGAGVRLLRAAAIAVAVALLGSLLAFVVGGDVPEGLLSPMLEALTGQLYLVTAVAVSVANLRQRER